MSLPTIKSRKMMSMWRPARLKKFFSKLTSAFLIFQLTFFQTLSLVLPSVVTAQTIQDYSVDFQAENHQLVINAGKKLGADYKLYYQSQDQIQAATGQLDTQTEIYLGTCSTTDCSPVEVERLVLKLSTEVGVVQRFTLENGVVSLEKEYQTSDLELNQAEQNWLAGKTDQGWIINEDGSYTFEEVRVGETYSAPQNDQVQLTFTQLPEESGNLTIKEVNLSPAQVEALGALSSVAYDITSNMSDGSFAYDLVLPNPQPEKEVKVKYSEDGENFVEVEGEAKEEQVVKIRGLDHFTVFVVTGSGFTPNNSTIFTVDNGDGGYSDEPSGAWSNSGSSCSSVAIDGDGRFSGDLSAEANWNFTVPVDGVYKIYAHWVSYSSQATLAEYSLFEDGGLVFTDQVSQKGSNCIASGWQLLTDEGSADNEFGLTAGNSYKVTLSQPSVSGNLYADAIKVALIEEVDEVWVDDDWTSFSPGDLVAGPSGDLVFGHNAFETIQEGIDQVAEGGTVNVAAGNYTPTSSLVFDKSLTLSGEDKDSTVIDITGFNAYGMRLEANDLTIENFTIQGNEVANQQYPIHAFSNSGVTGLTLKSLTVLDSYRTGVDLNSLSDSQPNLLEDITVMGAENGFGISLSSGQGVTLKDISTNNNAWGDVGIYPSNQTGNPTQGIVFMGTLNLSSGIGSIAIQPNGASSQPEDDISYSTSDNTDVLYDVNADVIVPSDFNHVVYALRSDGLKTHFLLQEDDATATAQNLAASSFSDITIRNLETSHWEVVSDLLIQDAIDAASDGDQINVSDGTFTENLNVNKALTLINSSNPILDGGATGTSVVEITADDVTISGFTIQNSGTATANIGGIFINDANGALIENNTIQNNDHGILIGYNAGHNIIKNNSIINNLQHGVFSGGYAENIDNHLNKNIISDNGSYGVYSKGQNSGIFDATKNWWGDASGPSDQGPGTGDKVSANVTFCPWLDAENGNEVGDCLGEIQGRKYEETTGDDYQNNDEKPGLNDWEIRLYSDDWLEMLASMTTGEDSKVRGSVYDDQFRFEDLQPGSYHVCEVSTVGNYQASPASEGDNPKDNNGSVQHTNAEAVKNESPNKSEEAELCWRVDISGDETVGWVKFGNIIDLSAPTSSVQLQGDLDESKNISGDAGWHGYGWYESYDQIELNIETGDATQDFINYQILSGDVSCPTAGDGSYAQQASDGENLAALVNGQDGVHTLCYYAQDLAGNMETSVNSQVLKIDDQIPEYELDFSSINGNEVGGKYYLSENKLTYQVQVDDLLSGYTRGRYDLYSANESWACSHQLANQDNLLPPSVSTSRSFEINGLADGRYCTKTWIYDDVQNKSWTDVNGEQWIYFVVDTQAPVLDISAIRYLDGTIEADKFITSYTTPTILGTTSDDVSLVELSVDGENYTANLTGTDWEVDINKELPDGSHAMTVVTTDLAGNTTTQEQVLVVDTIAPTATHAYYKNNQEIGGFNTYIEDGKKFAQPVVKVRDVSELSFTGEYEDSDPSAGLYWDSYVIFQAQDDGSFRFAANGKQSFCGWRSEPNLVDISGASEFSLTQKQAFTNCVDSLPDGEYYLTHHIYDQATRDDIPSINQFRDVLGLRFIVDSTPPTSTITDPAESSSSAVYLNDWDGVVGGESQDENSGVEKVLLSIQRGNGSGDYWDGSSWVFSATEITFEADPNGDADSEYDWTYDFLQALIDNELDDEAGIPEDSYLVTSHAQDKAGNLENTSELTIIVDKTIPQIDLTTDPTDPDGENSWFKTEPTITLTATDDQSPDGFKQIEYQWNSEGGAWTTTSETTLSFNPPGEGINVLYYRAQDQAGNYSETGIKTIRYDATDLEEGPLNVSANPNPTSDETAIVSWDAAKDGVLIDKYEIIWKLQGTDTQHSKTLSADLTETEIDQLTEEGTWTVTVRAFDGVGNNKEDSADLVVDRSAPQAPVLSLDGTDTGTASLSWNSVEDAKEYLLFYGTTSGDYIYGANVGDVTQYTVQGLGAGTYYFVVRAKDNADNQSPNSNEVNTGLITGAPGVEPGAPAEGFIPEGEVQGATDVVDEDGATQDEAQSGSVLGAQAENGWGKYLPLWLLILQLVLILGADLITKNKNTKGKQIWALGATAAVIALFYSLVNSEMYLAGSLSGFLSTWFWVLSVLLYLITRALNYAFIEEVA